MHRPVSDDAPACLCPCPWLNPKQHRSIDYLLLQGDRDFVPGPLIRCRHGGACRIRSTFCAMNHGKLGANRVRPVWYVWVDVPIAFFL